MDRRLLLSLPLALVFAAGASPKVEDAQPYAREIDAILRAGLDQATRANGAAARRAAVKTFLREHGDLSRVSRFVLGRAARTATSEELAAFETAFAETLAAAFASALDDFSPASLHFERAVARSPGDVVVSYTVSGASGRKAASVRAMRTPTKWRIVDVEANGVWLAVMQQQQIAAMLDQPGATIATITERIKAVGSRQSAVASR